MKMAMAKFKQDSHLRFYQKLYITIMLLGSMFKHIPLSLPLSLFPLILLNLQLK